jgi:hypothetical protein
MKNLILISARHILTIVALLSFFQITSAQSKDEKQIAEALEILRGVMVIPDSVVLASLVSDHLEYVHSSGTVRDKKGFVKEFMKRQTNLTKAEFLDQTIKITGDMAIVRHRLLADANIPGYPPVIDVMIMMVWKKENGTWKMFARQAFKLPEKK